jgi:hypothetical protein
MRSILHVLYYFLASELFFCKISIVGFILHVVKDLYSTHTNKIMIFIADRHY